MKILSLVILDAIDRFCVWIAASNIQPEHCFVASLIQNLMIVLEPNITTVGFMIKFLAKKLLKIKILIYLKTTILNFHWFCLEEFFTSQVQYSITLRPEEIYGWKFHIVKIEPLSIFWWKKNSPPLDLRRRREFSPGELN